MNLYNIEKGELGEKLVCDVVDEVISDKNFSDECYVLKNPIFKYKSIYGADGFTTAEIDICVLTPFYIYLIEVKNEAFCNFNSNEPLSLLVNNEIVSNPIFQNHFHKLVFCSEFNIRRERVITIEVILDNNDLNITNPVFANDFVFLFDDFKEYFSELLDLELKRKFNTEVLYNNIKSKTLFSSFAKEQHINNLKKITKIMTRQKRVTGNIKFKRTDTAICPYCNTGELQFKDMPYISKKNKKTSHHYALGCSNYNEDSIECDCGLLYVDKDKPFDKFISIIPISIEERNNWDKEKWFSVLKELIMDVYKIQL